MLYYKSSLIEKEKLLLNTTQPTHHVVFGFLYFYSCLLDFSLNDHHNRHHHHKHHQRKINHLILHPLPPLADGFAITLCFYLNFLSCGLVKDFVDKNYLHSYEN